MAYVEVRKEGKLVMQKQVDDELARKGFRIRVGTAGNVFLKLGQSQTLGDYVVTLYKGQSSEDAYHAVDDLKKAAGAIPPINIPKAQNVTVSADAGDAGGAGEQKKYPHIEGFEITGRLGEGGMGTVWRGVQLSTKREVAIKFLSVHRFTSQKAKTRFEREVAMAAKLNHPNIAQVYDSGVHRGVYYYAMELIEGIHLDKYVQREELSPREVMKLMRDVCDAVCHAHQHGIIHRDLKPSNILVTPFGKPTIVDFGLAKSFENEHEDATISIEGDITGTPAYMAPEQAAGRIKDISERTDVYALGVIIYQLTAGCLPHDISGSHYDIFRRIVEEDVKSPRTVNPAIDSELDSILLTCLAREPENRYPSASVLVKDIDNYLSGKPLLSKSFSTTYRVVKQFRRNRIKIALSGIFATMLAAIILLLCFIYSSSRPDSKTEPTSQQDKQGSTEVVIDRDKPVTANKGSEPKAGEVITNSIGMKLVYIPAGQFQMGNPLSAEEVAKQYGGQTDEFNNAPTHPVKITHGFYMGQMEVTVNQFSEFVKATGYQTEAEKKGTGRIFSVVDSKIIPVQGLNWRNPGIEQEANHPVVQIAWNDAKAFCKWLSKKENKTYRLPTEAQWEYACRAGTQTEFYWGNETETGIAYANLCDQSAQKWADNQGGSFSFALKSDDHAAATAPVGSYKPNAFGLYDMHGNVWEWCADWYGSDYYAQSPAQDPQGPDFGKEHILRGASWYCQMGYYRSAYRGKLGLSSWTSGTGFRVCLFDGQTPPRPKEVDEAVADQNPPQSLSLQRNQPPAAISINDKPFFVICARNAVPEEFEEYKKAGFNTVYTHLSSNPALDEAQKHGLYAIHNFADYKCKDGLFLPEFWQEAEQQTTRWNNHPALLGWMQSSNNFQGRLNSSEIQRLYNLLDAKNPRKLKLLLYGFDENNWKQIYPYSDYTDVAVLENWSILENIPATTVWFEHALELAKKRPIWYIVPANSRIWEKLSFPLVKFRSIAYLGINHGATGILVDGFQNQLWAEWMKAYKRDNISGLADPQLADLRKEALRLAGELKTLSPAILAGSLKDSSKLSSNSQIDFQAFADPENTTLYFIAVNLSNQIITSSFFIPDGLQDSIEVLNEGRTLQQINSQFSDSFEPQETHIYILKPDKVQAPQAESAATNLAPKAQQETELREKWRKAMKDAQVEFQSINDRESADFVGTILDSLDKPQGMSPSALAAHANRLESKTRELVRKGALESAAIHNYAMWSARVMPGPGADAPARAGQQRRNNSPSRADGLVLYMPFDAPPANSMVLDESGTGNHGKVEGAQWIPEGGRFGGAYQFHITNLTDRIVIPDSDSLNPRKVTVTAWIKTPDTDGFWNRIIDKDFRKGYVLCLGGDFNGKRDRGKLGFEANSKYIASDQPLGDDRWHHVAGTFDGETIKLYVDGVEKKQTPKNSKPITGNHWDLCIGNSVVDYGTGEFLGFDGLIDEVRVYNRVLSAEEIQTLATASQAGKDIANPIASAPEETSQPLPKQELATGLKFWSKRNPSPAAINIEGKPFFVICARSAVPEEFEEYKKAGINTVETNLPSNPALDEAKKHGLYAIHRFADYKCKEGLFLPEFWQETQENITAWKSHPALLAWEQSADLLTPYKNPSEIKKIFDILSVKSPEKLKLLSYDFNDENWKLFYPYNTYCDVVVLENFPIRKNIPVTALWFQRAFELANGKPVWYTVHANIWRDESPSVREFRTSTYLGINHGATGILIDGFQSRLWAQWMDAYKINDGFGMADPRLASLRREALRIAGELKTLSPAILAGSIKEETELFDNQQLDCGAFADPQNSTLYIIAVNPSDQLAVSSFHVPKGMASPIEVLNENRTIEHNAGAFTDAFEQNETHVYICKYPQKNTLNPDSSS